MDDKNTPPTLRDLDAKLRAHKAEREAEEQVRRARRTDGRGLGLAIRIGVELISAIAVGAGIGYLLDGWLHTMPLFLIVFLLMGGAAGVMNVYRVVKGLDDTVGLGQAVRRKEDEEAEASAAGRHGKNEE